MNNGARFSRGVPVGDGEYLPAADFLLMAGFLVYEAPLAPANARAAARDILHAVLSERDSRSKRRNA